MHPRGKNGIWYKKAAVRWVQSSVGFTDSSQKRGLPRRLEANWHFLSVVVRLQPINRACAATHVDRPAAFFSFLFFFREPAPLYR